MKTFGLVGWMLALVSNEPIMYFYSVGFLASLAQGVAHNLTGELATLPQLNAVGGAKKVAYELAHTTYFPSLLLQSCRESLVG